jgi:hypothetical protein
MASRKQPVWHSAVIRGLSARIEGLARPEERVAALEKRTA